MNVALLARNTEALATEREAAAADASTCVVTIKKRVTACSVWRKCGGFAADKFVGLAASAACVAYQKLAARIFTRRTFISILKLYVTDTACIAKWQPLEHNDYETIIIWRSTGGGPHPKCSLRAVYKGHARAVTLISKRNFCSLRLSLSASLPIFIVSPRDSGNAQKVQRVCNCL